METLIQFMKEKTAKGERFQILSTSRYAYDKYPTINKLDPSIDKSLFHKKTEREISTILKSVLNGKGKIDMEDVSIVVADYYDYNYIWDKLEIDVHINGQKYNLRKNVKYEYEKGHFSIQDLAEKIDNIIASKNGDFTVDQFEGLFLYSKLICWASSYGVEKSLKCIVIDYN